MLRRYDDWVENKNCKAQWIHLNYSKVEKMNEVLIEINIVKYQQCENLKLKNSSDDQQQKKTQLSRLANDFNTDTILPFKV